MLEKKEKSNQNKQIKQAKVGIIVCFWSLLFCMSFFFCKTLVYAAEKEINLAFTHDLHSYFDTRTTILDGAQIEQGGFAKMKTILDGLRETYPNMLTVDAGDFSMGTLYQTIYETKASELRMLGALGFDVTTLGNHEFDYHLDGFSNMLLSAIDSKDTLPQLVIGNIDWKKTEAINAQKLQQVFEQYGVKDYTIFEKDGLKIGVFGVFGRDSDSSAPLSGLEFRNTVKAAKEIVKRMKEEENPDFILCLSHSGTSDKKRNSEDEILAKKVPDIDVIISGHTHTKLEQAITIGNTIIGSSGKYGDYVGQMQLRQKETGRWELSQYNLIPVDQTVKEEINVQKLIEKYKKQVQTQYLSQYNYEFDEVLAYNPIAFTSLDDISELHEESTLGNLITDSYIYAVKQIEGQQYETISMVAVPSGTIRGTFGGGNITVSDVFHVSSLGIGQDGTPGYPLVSVYLTGKELKQVAEIDASISPNMKTARIFTSGLQFTFNPNRLWLNKVTDVSLKRENNTYEEIEDKKLYRVVAGLYTAQMLGAVKEKSFGLLSIVPKDNMGNPIEDFSPYIIKDGLKELKEWEALASYIQSFDKQNGISAIPMSYSSLQGRKIVEDSTNIKDLIKNPNWVLFSLYGVIAVLFFLIIAIIIVLIKRRRGRKRKTTYYTHEFASISKLEKGDSNKK